MTSRHLLTTLLATPLLVALQPRGDNVAFHPEDGSSLSKEYGIDFTFSIGDITAYADGQDLSESVPADFELVGDTSMVVTDKYVETVGGRPLQLIRTFDSMEMYWEAMDDSGDAEEFSELEGKSVKFVWNEEDEAYDVSYHESEGDEELLQGLGVDMDLRALLPEGEVSEGDTWTVAARQLASVIFYGTNFEDLDMSLDDEDIGPLIESELLPQIENLMEGFSGECEYLGRADVDGTSIGRIGLKIAGEGTIDLVGFIERVLEQQMPQEMEFDASVDEASIELSMDGEGELRWDLDAGHLHDYEMSSEMEILVDVYISIDVGGESHELEASIEVLGDGSWTAAVVQ